MKEGTQINDQTKIRVIGLFIFAITAYLILFSISVYSKIERLESREKGMSIELKVMREIQAHLLANRKKNFYYIPPQKERRINYGN